jgi:uncharacterized membrane protein YqjE
MAVAVREATMTELRTRTAEERSIGKLFGELSQDVALLVRQEAQLAKTEMQQKITRVKADLMAMVSGGVVVYLGALSLTAAVILLLIDPVGLKPWLAALLVGLVLAVAGYIMLQRGAKDIKRTDPTPRRTVETIKEDIQWAKEQRP